MTAHGTYPHRTPDGRLAAICLDWSGRDGVRHWGGGMLRCCRSCQQPTLLVDDDGRPQHKTCAEHEAELTLAKSTPAARAAEPGINRTDPEAEALW